MGFLKFLTIPNHLITLFILSFSFIHLSGQEINRSDYDRAISFLFKNVNNQTAYNLFVEPNWFADSSGLWYVLYHQEGKSFYQIKFVNPTIKPLFDHKRLADSLKDKVEGNVYATDLAFHTLNFLDKTHIQFKWKSQTYKLDLHTYNLQLVKEEEEPAPSMESKSPNGKWIAFTKDYNLYLRSTETEEIYQLSSDGKKNYEYASYYGWYDKMEGENGDRPERFSVNWSPDSKYLRANIVDLRSANKMMLLDWSVDSLYRPRLLSYYRGSPGDTAMVYLKPVFFDVEQKKEVKTNFPRNTHINPISFRWSKKSGEVFVNIPERGYQKQEIFHLDLQSGEQKLLVTETSETNIDNFSYWLVEDKGKLVFASERSGWRQLYALDLESLDIKRITDGDYYVNGIEHINEDKGIIYFMASGREEARNPYLQNLYRVNLEGKKLKLLTAEDRHHQVDFSPDGKYFFDNYSSANQPTISVLRESNSGKIVNKISEADISLLEKKNWKPPQLFEAVGRDGKTTIYGALWKPTHFDPNKKYPLIDHSYTGPHTQMFPKDFRRVLSTSNQALAELGFIVMMVDGMGSSGRSKAFHDVSYKNMGLNLKGHVLAIEQLGKRFSWIDTDRVGIFGHSAGGYDAGHAMLQFPEVYKVAVASSADHDFRMEKAWWPEMYMGWPVDSTYHLQSNITMADRLQGKLLITHGGLDDNVNPSATFKLAEALVKADKEFDLLIFPSQRHGYRGNFSNYFLKKRWNYFVEHLLGAEPIWDLDLE